VPLCFVLFVGALKEISEDMGRHRSDHEENTAVAHVIIDNDTNTVDTKDVAWKDLQVGDVIEVRNRENIPADIILMETSHPEGQAQIMTANLDGETNLKTMSANSDMVKVKSTATNATGSQTYFGGELTCELPNNRLLNFEGTYTREDGVKVSLGPKNVLLRGVVLRQTEWARGVVCYTGRETKIQMNSADPPSKTSSVMQLANSLTFWMFAVDATLSLCAALYSANSLSQDWVKDSCYLWGNCPGRGFDETLTTPPAGMTGFLTFWTHVLIFTNLIPISLLVTIDMVKLGQAKMMQYDLDMFYEMRDHTGEKHELPFEVKRSELNEELGQVSHIFSDKTGTLTCNMMDFRKCSINGESYGLGTTAIGLSYLKRNNLPVPLVPEKPRDALETPHVNFVDPKFEKVMSDPSHKEYKHCCEFFLSLALNHEVLPEKSGSGEILYSASSPDEAALVYAAKHFGFFFKAKEQGGKFVVEMRNKNNSDVVYEILEFLEFNSDRKRSSVLVKDSSTGKLILYSKGADNVMKKRLASSNSKGPLLSKTEQHLDEFVNDGLRTLIVAKTVVDVAFYKTWKKEFTDAENSLENRDEKRMAVMEKIEKNLQIMGVTAIEDKLQDGVDGTLVKFRGADIKVWMLTGDKVDTAINIGFSCSLIDPSMTLLRACGEDGDMEVDHDKCPTKSAITKKLSDLMSVAQEESGKDTPIQCALIVDTAALSSILMHAKETELNEICKLCKSVICARVTPRQKAAIVDMVRRADPTLVTLSVGDGANDVPMIQTAHIGVGIHGLEGKQAVNNSDYAIGQFRFLKKLLLVHGRWNYRRTCFVCLYMFYKNVVYVAPQFMFAMKCMASGQPIYNDAIYQAYNTCYTATPIMCFGIFDQDVSLRTALENPWLYKDGQEGKFMSTGKFFKWVAQGLAHASVCFIFPVNLWNYGVLGHDGSSMDIFTIGSLCNMMAVVLASGRLYCECRYFNYPTLYQAKGNSCSSKFFEGLVSFTGAQFSWPMISFAFWFWSVDLMNKLPTNSYVSDLSGSFTILFNSGTFLFAMIIAMVICGVMSFSIVLASDLFFNGPLRSTVAMEKTRAAIKEDSVGCCEKESKKLVEGVDDSSADMGI